MGAVEIISGNGKSLQFWHDPWLTDERSLADLAPAVAEALDGNGWLRAIQPELSLQALVDILAIYDLVAGVTLFGG